MDFFPVFLDLKGQECLVIGGDEVAEKKVLLLVRAGARITLIAKNLTPALKELASQGSLKCDVTEFSAQVLDGCKLVICNTEDIELSRHVSQLAQERCIPVNVIDTPELCSFIVPSIVDRSPLQIAISTGGASPSLARFIRARVEAMLPHSYGRLATLLKSFRERSRQVFSDASDRRKHWERIFASSLIEKFLSGKEEEVEKALEKEFESPEKETLKQGQVFLVGAGPGDPDLLTIRALRLIQDADVVVYDRLVAPALLEYARRDAEQIYVGKKSAYHTLPQEKINQLLVDLAKQGKSVVRLKGGDPFIFGRGGEEIEMLIEAGIDFQVVPGITAASGCGTYAGIPLTHRDYAQSCVMVTGHLKQNGLDLNWTSLVQPQQTVVFYMGISNIEVLCKELIAHGMRPDMPAALVQQGTTINQRVFTGTVSNLPELVLSTNVKPPTLVIIGEVVSLQKKLAWFKPSEAASNTFRQ